MELKLRARLKGFLDNSKHVLNVSYRPTREEFNKSAKIIIIGILAMGVLGFVLGVIISLLVTGTVPLI